MQENFKKLKIMSDETQNLKNFEKKEDSNINPVVAQVILWNLIATPTTSMGVLAQLKIKNSNTPEKSDENYWPVL
jgi:hypothetical protein